jgi:prephenate dehydrogenase
MSPGALADADGIELTGATEPEQRGDVIVLAMTVEATPDMVAAAVREVAEGLPAGATISVGSGPA